MVHALEGFKLQRCLLSAVLIVSMIVFVGCGPNKGAAVLEGDAKLNPDVGSEVNDPTLMQDMMNADPSPPK